VNGGSTTSRGREQRVPLREECGDWWRSAGHDAAMIKVVDGVDKEVDGMCH